MKRYIEIKFQSLTPEQAEILIAELSDTGFYAFEEGDNSLNAYIEEKDFSEGVLETMLLPSGTTYRKTIIADQNWNTEWERHYQPVNIDGRVVVRANFHPAVNGAGYEIIITPKMSFGTGHHATTAMMISLMLSMDLKGKRVIDFGTGTGVLAILASKLGAEAIDAIDIDDWSIENARENIAANGCRNVKVWKAEKVNNFQPAKIVLANINTNVLLANADSLAAKTRDNGYLVLSGFIEKDVSLITAKYEKCGFVGRDTREEGQWRAMVLQKL